MDQRRADNMTNDQFPRSTNGELADTSHGYPLLYLDGEGSVLCPSCAREGELEYEGDRIFADWLPCVCAINWEDSELYCDECSERIPGAYAEDE